uniref:Galectin n=1 Tax=Glossina brevipalpis TaxID=37001 RepID=A0A1A9WMR1_9MUSC
MCWCITRKRIQAKKEMTKINYKEGVENLVYLNRSLQLLSPGTCLTILGYTKTYCETFSINLIIENNSRDIALHIRPQLPQHYVIRNSKIHGVWGEPEIASPLPFTLKRGRDFFIQIFVTHRRFLINVNGIHFCKFHHRLFYREIETIEVKGDVEDISVERVKANHYPEHLPQNDPIKIRVEGSSFSETPTTSEESDTDEYDDDTSTSDNWLRISLLRRPRRTIYAFKLPFLGTFKRGSFINGRILKIEGKMKLLPQSFLINIQKGRDIWPHPMVALHLRADFSLHNAGLIGRTTLLRSAYIDGEWSIGKRTDVNTELRPGKAFSLSIVAAKDSFQIYINYSLVSEFLYRCDPAKIDTIYIQGDIRLLDVVLTGEVLFRSVELKHISAMTLFTVRKLT